jgi:hypothetical protein
LLPVLVLALVGAIAGQGATAADASPAAAADPTYAALRAIDPTYAALRAIDPTYAALRAIDPTYAALRAARPDGRVVPVKGLVLERDVFRFQFDSGAFHFLAPVAGRTVGAVFLGQGRFRLSPATEAERRQLALASGAGQGFEVLDDVFDELVLLFVDDTAQEIGLAAPVESRAPDLLAVQAYERWLKRQRQDFTTNFQLRLLQDLLNTPGLTSGVFLALFYGKKLPPALAAVDPNGAEGLNMGNRLGGEHSIFVVADQNRGGVWYLCNRRAEVERKRAAPVKRWAHAIDYKVETTVQGNMDLAGATTIHLQVLSPGLRVLPINLLPKLRISEAVFAPEAAPAREPAWRAVAVVQEGAQEDADAAVVFPEPLAKGAKVLLRVSYKGDEVLADAGDRNYVVRARESWYPNLGVFTDPALFELVYRVPEGNEIVSVGRLVEARTEGRQAVSVWKTDLPVQVAGFNYGRFKKLEKHDSLSGLDVAVYTNPGLPDVVREINAVLSSPPRGDMGGLDADGELHPGTPIGPTLGRVNTSRLAESALADGLNAARVFTTYFGPLPVKQVAITQQSQFSFGQSWPSLIFMPYISFLDGTQRQRIGLAAANSFVDQVGFHELAHQWWGHLVGAESYRDAWLEEGFAEFSAALAVQHTRGWGAYGQVWRNARRILFSKPPGNAVENAEAGPISQGTRLATHRSPWAFDAVVYFKGAYVLHMLRMMMWDAGAALPDARFIEMMKDFALTYGGKEASTADFQKIVERHMTPAMNATGNGKMDWFFAQWVYGTEVPHYAANLEVQPEGDHFRVRGKVTQEGVSADFRALLPLYLELAKGENVRIGMLPMVGNATVAVDIPVRPPRKPRRALINAGGEVLARD